MEHSPLEATAAELASRGHVARSGPNGAVTFAPGVQQPQQMVHPYRPAASLNQRSVANAKDSSGIPAVPAIKTRNGPDAKSFGEAFSFLRGSDAAGLFQPVGPVQDMASGHPSAVAQLIASRDGSGSSGSTSVAVAGATAYSTVQAFAGAAAGTQGQAATVPPAKMFIQVSPRQKGNPVLSSIRNVAWQYLESLRNEGPDFVVGAGVCVLYLSMKFHLLNKGYVYGRLKGIRKHEWKMRVLLVNVDIQDCEVPLADLGVACVANDLSLVVAFSPEEAARYLEVFKAYEHKSAAAIQERVEATYLPRAQEALTTIRSINKTDVINLLGHFGSVASIMTASRDDLGVPPGFGDKKVRRLYEAFHTPFEGYEAGGAGAGARAGALSAGMDQAFADALMDNEV